MCKKCKYYDEDDGCIFYAMGSGNPHDMPCYKKEKDDIADMMERESERSEE